MELGIKFTPTFLGIHLRFLPETMTLQYGTGKVPYSLKLEEFMIKYTFVTLSMSQ